MADTGYTKKYYLDDAGMVTLWSLINRKVNAVVTEHKTDLQKTDGIISDVKTKVENLSTNLESISSQVENNKSSSLTDEDINQLTVD